MIPREQKEKTRSILNEHCFAWHGGATMVQVHCLCHKWKKEGPDLQRLRREHTEHLANLLQKALPVSNLTPLKMEQMVAAAIKRREGIRGSKYMPHVKEREGEQILGDITAAWSVL